MGPTDYTYEEIRNELLKDIPRQYIGQRDPNIISIGTIADTTQGIQRVSPHKKQSVIGAIRLRSRTAVRADQLCQTDALEHMVREGHGYLKPTVKNMTTSAISVNSFANIINETGIWYSQKPNTIILPSMD